MLLLSTAPKPQLQPHHPPEPPWEGALQTIQHWGAAVGHVLGWFSVEHLASVAVILAPIVAAATLLRIWSIERALRKREAYALVPTTRAAGLKDDHIAFFARAVGQVRNRRRHLWTRPAGAVRLRLDSLAYHGTIHSVEGPEWMYGLLRTGNYGGLVVPRMDRLDLSRIGPKGLLPDPPEPPDDADATTGEINVPAGPPR